MNGCFFLVFHYGSSSLHFNWSPMICSCSSNCALRFVCAPKHDCVTTIREFMCQALCAPLFSAYGLSLLLLLLFLYILRCPYCVLCCCRTSVSYIYMEYIYICIAARECKCSRKCTYPTCLNIYGMCMLVYENLTKRMKFR